MFLPRHHCVKRHFSGIKFEKISVEHLQECYKLFFLYKFFIEIFHNFECFINTTEVYFKI